MVIAECGAQMSNVDAKSRQGSEKTPRHRELFEEGLRSQNEGQLAEAVRLYNECLILAPGYQPALNNLGVALRKARRFEASIACYRRLLEQDSSNVQTLSNLGNVLKDAGRHEEALGYFEHAMKLNPDDVATLYNLGIALKDAGFISDAIEVYKRCLAQTPEDTKIKWDLALAQLCVGDLANGWTNYESRWFLEDGAGPPFADKRWNGEDLDGTILLAAEQGFGDAIQFVRYAGLVKKRCRRVVLKCREELRTLFETVEGIDEIVTTEDELPSFDAFMPLLSLPGVFGTTLSNVPSTVPYFQIDGEKRQKAKNILAPLGKRLRVGIVWGGSPGHLNDYNRSLKFVDFMCLLEVPNLALLSLQVGDRVDDIRKSGCGSLVTNLSPLIEDYNDTAAIVAELDLVIMCDSSVAHLAGAIGKPVWVLLPYAPDWRWLTKRSDSPWYPSMKLYRQSHPKRWDDVFRRVVEDLRILIDERSASDQ